MPGDQINSQEADPAELLRLAQARFGSLIRSLPVGIAIVAGDGTVEAANPCMLNLFGYDEREVVKRKLQTLLVKAPWQDDLRSWCAANPESTVELEGKAKEGDRIRIDVSVRTLDADAYGRYVVVVQDVARRYLAEQMKQQFYRMINHDIRSPLASVLIFLEALSGDNGDLPEMVDKPGRLKAARGNLERVISLAEELLQIDRMESGSFNVKLELSDVREIVDKAVAGVRELAADRGLTIKAQTVDVRAHCDPNRLLLVMINILTNAIKHSPPGGTIELACECRAQNLRISIRDHGSGIPESEKTRIFEQFQQGERHAEGGFGLGLYICRQIIKEHGGTIGCQDAPGGGALFWFELPLTPQDGNQRS